LVLGTLDFWLLICELRPGPVPCSAEIALGFALLSSCPQPAAAVFFFPTAFARRRAVRVPASLGEPAPLLCLVLPESAPPFAALISIGPVLRLETDAARFSAQPR
jgi:hypothetical protein